MKDEATGLYPPRLCAYIAMDMAAMLVKDLGMIVEEDYTNIEMAGEN